MLAAGLGQANPALSQYDGAWAFEFDNEITAWAATAHKRDAI